MHPQYAPLLQSQPTLQCFPQLRASGSHPRMSQIRQPLGVGLSCNQCTEDGPAADAHQIADQTCDLQAGYIKRLLDTERVPADLAQTACACG